MQSPSIPSIPWLRFAGHHAPPLRAPLECYTSDLDLPLDQILTEHAAALRGVFKVEGRTAPFVLKGISPAHFERVRTPIQTGLPWVREFAVSPNEALTWHQDRPNVSIIASAPYNQDRGPTLFMDLRAFLRHHPARVRCPWNAIFPDGLIQEATWSSLTADGTAAMVFFDELEVRHTGTPSPLNSDFLYNIYLRF